VFRSASLHSFLSKKSVFPLFRSLFSPLKTVGLSLGFSSLSLSKNLSSPSCFCFFPSVSASLSFSKISPVRSSISHQKFPLVLIFLSAQKSSPAFWLCSLPCIYRQPGERFTIPCPSTGHGGRGMGLLIFIMVGGMGLLFLH